MVQRGFHTTNAYFNKEVQIGLYGILYVKLLLQKYEEYYSAEEELNNQLNVFAINYSIVYGGFNDVKTQLGFASENGKYPSGTLTLHCSKLDSDTVFILKVLCFDFQF